MAFRLEHGYGNYGQTWAERSIIRPTGPRRAEVLLADFAQPPDLIPEALIDGDAMTPCEHISVCLSQPHPTAEVDTR